MGTSSPSQSTCGSLGTNSVTSQMPRTHGEAQISAPGQSLLLQSRLMPTPAFPPPLVSGGHFPLCAFEPSASCTPQLPPPRSPGAPSFQCSAQASESSLTPPLTSHHPRIHHAESITSPPPLSPLLGPPPSPAWMVLLASDWSPSPSVSNAMAGRILLRHKSDHVTSPPESG